jgi:hypothetical protein
VRTAYDELGYTVKDEQLDVDAVAEENGLEPPIVRRDLYKGLQKFLRRSDALAKDFRWAMFWLCESEAHLQGSPEDVSAILDWLRGDLRLVSALKQYLIFRRIGRHNARSMLTSLGGWTRLAGRAGLVLVLDLRQLGISRRSNVAPDTNYYTLAGAMDCYEVLRQLIDDTDDLQGVLCLVVSNPSLFDDERRGVKVYKALYERVWPDVALRQTPNPLSSLVTLERS